MAGENTPTLHLCRSVSSLSDLAWGLRMLGVGRSAQKVIGSVGSVVSNRASWRVENHWNCSRLPPVLGAIVRLGDPGCHHQCHLEVDR